MEKEKEEILAFTIKYTRQERSKDSNGSSKEYVLKKGKLSYEVKNWGFKARKNPQIKKEKLSDRNLSEIYNLLEENSLLQDYNEVIKIEKRFSFSSYTYEAVIRTSDKTYEFSIVSNDLLTNDKIIVNSPSEEFDNLPLNHKMFKNFDKLFDYFKEKM